MANGAFANRMSVPGMPQTRKVWEHQELVFDHNGVQIKIHKEGKVTFVTTSPDPDNTGGVITDEVTVSASVIFKAAGALKMTRNEVEVPA